MHKSFFEKEAVYRKLQFFVSSFNMFEFLFCSGQQDEETVDEKRRPTGHDDVGAPRHSSENIASAGPRRTPVPLNVLVFNFLN